MTDSERKGNPAMGPNKAQQHAMDRAASEDFLMPKSPLTAGHTKDTRQDRRTDPPRPARKGRGAAPPPIPLRLERDHVAILNVLAGAPGGTMKDRVIANALGVAVVEVTYRDEQLRAAGLLRFDLGLPTITEKGRDALAANLAMLAPGQVGGAA